MSKELWKWYARAAQVSRESSAGLCPGLECWEQFKGGQVGFFCASHLALQTAAWEVTSWWVCCVTVSLWFLAFGKETLKQSLPPLKQQGGINPRVLLLWGDTSAQLWSLRLGQGPVGLAACYRSRSKTLADHEVNKISDRVLEVLGGFVHIDI